MQTSETRERETELLKRAFRRCVVLLIYAAVFALLVAGVGILVDKQNGNLASNIAMTVVGAVVAFGFILFSLMSGRRQRTL